jgi:dsRNA-specific ribonuclease
VDLLFRAKPTATQGSLTDLKCSITNNKTLGLLGLTLNLHRYIITTSPALSLCFAEMDDARMKECVDALLLQDDDSSITNNNEEEKDNDDDDDDDEVNKTTVSYAKGIKIVADVVEAVVGAIFMDSGCCLDTVQRVIRDTGVLPPVLLA